MQLGMTSKTLAAAKDKTPVEPAAAAASAPARSQPHGFYVPKSHITTPVYKSHKARPEDVVNDLASMQHGGVDKIVQTPGTSSSSSKKPKKDATGGPTLTDVMILWVLTLSLSQLVGTTLHAIVKLLTPEEGWEEVCMLMGWCMVIGCLFYFYVKKVYDKEETKEEEESNSVQSHWVARTRHAILTKALHNGLGRMGKEQARMNGLLHAHMGAGTHDIQDAIRRHSRRHRREQRLLDKMRQRQMELAVIMSKLPGSGVPEPESAEERAMLDRMRWMESVDRASRGNPATGLKMELLSESDRTLIQKHQDLVEAATEAQQKIRQLGGKRQGGKASSTSSSASSDSESGSNSNSDGEILDIATVEGQWQSAGGSGARTQLEPILTRLPSTAGSTTSTSQRKLRARSQTAAKSQERRESPSRGGSRKTARRRSEARSSGSSAWHQHFIRKPKPQAYQS